MQVLIGNKLYDTLQNKQVACRKNGFESTDPRWQHEDLFLTENNEYFLIGRGGADSDYCHTINNQKCSGDKAILLTEQQATEWLAREHLVKGPNSCFFYKPILKGPQAESRQAPGTRVSAGSPSAFSEPVKTAVQKEPSAPAASGATGGGI